MENADLLISKQSTRTCWKICFLAWDVLQIVLQLKPHHRYSYRLSLNSQNIFTNNKFWKEGWSWKNRKIFNVSIRLENDEMFSKSFTNTHQGNLYDKHMRQNPFHSVARCKLKLEWTLKIREAFNDCILLDKKQSREGRFHILDHPRTKRSLTVPATYPFVYCTVSRDLLHENIALFTSAHAVLSSLNACCLSFLV